MNQKTFSFTARIDFNLSSDLTVQYYASPFITAGEYKNIKRITDPKAKKFEDRFYTFNNEISYSEGEGVYNIDENADGVTDYSFDNPNFNFKQYRSNLVIRWEYTPGSLLYFVWSQGSTEDTFRPFNFAKDLNTLFSTRGHNNFMIKLSYRIMANRNKRTRI
jgi:hypothetical protein